METPQMNECSFDTCTNKGPGPVILNQLNEIEIAFKTDVPPSRMPVISSSKDAQELLLHLFTKDHMQAREESVALFLNKANKVIGGLRVSAGGVTGTVVDIRLILSTALKVLACGVIIAHNHPSGSLTPSRADTSLTSKLKEAAALMDIVVLDHLILTPEAYYSFADEGIL